jgi:DNA-binding CsgD family transcriptional regulator
MNSGILSRGHLRGETPENRNTALTPRQAQITRLVADGNSNREIAATLGLTEGYVKVTLSRIYGKLHIRGRCQLLVWWWKAMSGGGVKPA